MWQILPVFKKWSVQRIQWLLTTFSTLASLPKFKCWPEVHLWEETSRFRVVLSFKVFYLYTHTFLEMSSGLPRSWSSAFEWPPQPGGANCPHLGPNFVESGLASNGTCQRAGASLPVITLWPWGLFLYLLAHIFIPIHPLFPNTGLPVPSGRSLFSVFSCFYICSCLWHPVFILPVFGSSHPLPCGEMSLPTLSPEFHWGGQYPPTHHAYIQAPWVVYAFSLAKE